MAAMLATAITTTEGPVRFDKEKKSAIKNVAISKLEKVAKNLCFQPQFLSIRTFPPKVLNKRDTPEGGERDSILPYIHHPVYSFL